MLKCCRNRCSSWTEYATERARALREQLSFVHLQLPSSAKDIDGLTVQINDSRRISEPELSEGIPIDGGTFWLAVSAPGYLPWGQTVDVPPRQAGVRVTIPELKRETPVLTQDTETSLDVNSKSDTSGATLEALEESADSTNGLTTEQWVVVGAVVTGAAGAVWAALEWNAWKQVEDRTKPYCPDRCISDYWANEHSKGVNSQRTAVIAGPASVLLLGAGAVLIAWSPSFAGLTGRLSPTGIALDGTF